MNLYILYWKNLVNVHNSDLHRCCRKYINIWHEDLRKYLYLLLITEIRFKIILNIMRIILPPHSDRSGDRADIYSTADSIINDLNRQKKIVFRIYSKILIK